MTFTQLQNSIAGYLLRGALVVSVGISLSLFSSEGAFAATFQVVTQPPIKLDDYRSVFSGFVGNNENESAVAWFEYGKNGVFEQSTGKKPIKGSDDFRDSVYYLDMNVEYVYRAVARHKQTNRTIYGEIKRFTINEWVAGGSSISNSSSGAAVGSETIKPVVTSAGNIVLSTDTSAVLRGSIVTGGLPAQGWFEWGVSKYLGNKTEKQNVPASRSLVEINDTIKGLSPNLTYYYRTVVSTDAGVTEGPVVGFTTKKSGDSKPSINNDTAASGGVSFCGITASDISGDMQLNGDTELFPKSNGVQSEQKEIIRALGWGSTIREQLFVMDEYGNISKPKDSFGFDTSRSKTSYLTNTISTGGILPDSFVEWILWLVIIYVVISRAHYHFVSKKRKQEERENREEEMEEMKQHQEVCFTQEKSSQPA